MRTLKSLELLKHPVQPVGLDDQGVARFKENAIVRYLLDNGGIDMNKIATLGFSKEDRMHFAQLIGYSVSGAGDLSYFDPITIQAADRMVDGEVDHRDAIIASQKLVLEEAKDAVRKATVALFNIHGDDLDDLAG